MEMMSWVEPWRKTIGGAEVAAKTDLCREHFTDVGLGEDAVDRVIRYTEGLAIIEQQRFAADGFILAKRHP